MSKHEYDIHAQRWRTGRLRCYIAPTPFAEGNLRACHRAGPLLSAGSPPPRNVTPTAPIAQHPIHDLGYNQPATCFHLRLPPFHPLFFSLSLGAPFGFDVSRRTPSHDGAREPPCERTAGFGSSIPKGTAVTPRPPPSSPPVRLCSEGPAGDGGDRRGDRGAAGPCGQDVPGNAFHDGQRGGGARQLPTSSLSSLLPLALFVDLRP